MTDKKRNIKKENFKKVNKRTNKGNKVKFKEKYPKLMMSIKIMIIIILLLCVIGAGILVGIFFGLFGNDFEITKEELIISASNSVIVDKDGNVIADLSGDEKRKIISLSDMPEYLPKAYVAIEDERFYKHSGVDIKRTGAAILNFAVKRDSSFGGSTITQQLVKNITEEKEDKGLAGIARKVKEWAKATQVERMLSKNQILELYLNILFVGGQNIHGVELGAEYYFNKSAKDLDLAECAFLAGINNSPNMYNPYSETKDHTELIKKRTTTVLNKMKELGYITNEEDYNKAIAKVNEGLKFEKSQSQGNVYSYHTDALIAQVINQVAEEKGISKELATNYVYSSGLTIHSTVDTKVQARLDEEFAKATYIRNGKDKNPDGSLKNNHSQAAMVVIDNKTGYVVGVAGGLGQKTESRGLNRGTQMLKQTGSSMKPIADIVPGLQEGVITAGTVYNDSRTEFNNGTYKPKNQGKFRGLLNVRDFIKYSQNIPAIKIMAELTPAKSIEYLKKMGISTLDDEKDNVLSLAIGGITNGISPLEMAAAYATIANDGEYISPTFYTKITDSNGNVVLEASQTKTRVMSEQTAYIAKSIVQEPVRGGGTATYCAISGMDVAAKTGTTNDDYDRWLCGFTQYYSAATWYGFDNNEQVIGWGQNPAGKLWAAVMKDIHAGLPGARFTRPNGIVSATICRDTGMKATDKCKNTYSEIFINGTIPKSCDGHGESYEICKETGKLANEFCPDKEKIFNKGVPPKEKLKLWKTYGSDKNEEIPTEVCDKHKKDEEDKKREDEERREQEQNNPNNDNNNNTKPDKNNTTNNGTSNNTTSGNTTANNNTSNNTTNNNVNNTTNNNEKNNTIGNNTKPKDEKTDE